MNKTLYIIPTLEAIRLQGMDIITESAWGKQPKVDDEENEFAPTRNGAAKPVEAVIPSANSMRN